MLALLVAGAPGCADPFYVSLGGNVAELASDAGGIPVCAPPSDDSAMLIPGSACGDGSEPEPDRCLSSSASVNVASDCAARRSFVCPPPPVSNSGSFDADSLDALLSQILRECRDEANALRVRFESGCATSFTLDVSDESRAPGVLECVSTRLATERYACAANASCGVGVIFRVPASSVEPDWY